MRKMYLMTMVFALFVAGTAKAQITDVYAGNDTIELRVGNYQYGFVQWQISHDTVNWTDIEGATDTIYRFLPTEKAYYRAEASFANCPPEFSRICYVQLPPKADAGPDRKLAEGDGATMFALLEEGCIGEWEIIEGQGGSLSDLHSPNAYFEGTDSEYRLKWTVTNACGSNSDTVCIKYLHTVMNDNFLVVDTTDFILSDSTQLLDGLYIIAFSDSITVTDSTLLVGVGDAPFLRKVKSFTYDESTNTYTFHTNQGTLADFLIEGVFSLDFSSILNDGRKVVVSDRYPTRKDIAELGWSGVYVKQPKQDGKGLRWNTEIGEPKLKWTPGNFSLPYDFEVIPTFTMEAPNFMCELEKTGWHVESFKFGLYNTAYMTSYQVYFPGKTSFSLKKKLPVLPKLPFPPIFIGPVEVTLQLSCDLNLKLEYSLGPDMSYYVVQRGFLCNYIMYDDVNGWTANSGRIDRRYDFDADWPEYGDVSAKVSLDLKLSFLFYSFIGPYAGFSLGFEGTHGTFGAGFTAEQFKVKEEYKLGAKMTVLGYDIMDFDWPFITHDLLNYQNPYSMQMKGGNHQVYIPGQPLPTALSVLVKKSNGKPSKGVRVKFETTDGDLSPEGTFTDNNGIATTNWTPATNSSGNLQAKAYSYNVKNEPVQGAPMVFSALHSESCSSLSVNAVYKNGLLKPQASGGTSPYLFSTDGVAYGLAPTIIPVQGQTYHFYVRDANQCTAECYYTHPSFSCLSSDLDVALVQRGNTLVAYATGGTAPYEFSLNDGAFVSSPLFNNLPNGTYAVTVRDANGCTAMDEMTIELENSTVQVTTLPVVEAEGVVTFKANIANVAGTPVVGKGFCYGRHHAPDFSATVVSCGDGDGDYSSFVTNTEVGVAYYVRAYVSTNNGVAWGNEVRFTGTGSLMASLYDDFNDGVINTDLWTASGSDVYEEEGLLKMEQNITDDLVGVWSRPLTVPASNQVVIDRSFMLHRANNHFDGPLLFGFNESEHSGHWPNCGFRVGYYHEDYQGLYGTYLVFRWNGEDMEKIRLCDAVYDTWVTERVVFDVAAKTISYYRDNDFVAMVDLPNELRQIDIAFYTVAFRPYGWWTGHYHYMDYVDINHAGTLVSRKNWDD